jgi:hypothetical protein
MIIAGWFSLDSTGQARPKAEIAQRWGFIPPRVSASALEPATVETVLLDGENTQRRVSLGGNP